MKHSVETEENTNNQTIILTAEDYLDVGELTRIRQEVDGNGVELEITKTEAVLRIPLRLRAVKAPGGKGRGKQPDAAEEAPLGPQEFIPHEGEGNGAKP